MTAPATIDREVVETMYVSDAELIKRLGVGEKPGRTIINELCTKHPGFPKKQPAFGNRRYWPAIRKYFDKMNGLAGGL